MYRQDEPEVNFEQILERIKGVFGRFRGGGGRGGNGIALIVLGVFVVALGIWMGSGFYTVQPGEQAALRRFGAFETLTGPGLHWFWPSPIGVADRTSAQGGQPVSSPPPPARASGRSRTVDPCSLRADISMVSQPVPPVNSPVKQRTGG